MSGLRIEQDFEALDLLADAFQNAPATVEPFAREAGQEAIAIFHETIVEGTTPVDTGHLQDTSGVSLEGVFNIVYTAAADYAEPVDDRTNYVDNGTLIGLPRVDAAYEHAMDRVAETFFHGA